MQPGDCFTIEVRRSLCRLNLDRCLTHCAVQPAVVQGNNPSGVTYPDEWTVSTEVEPASTVSTPKTELTVLPPDLRSRCPSRAHGLHHRDWRRSPDEIVAHPSLLRVYSIWREECQYHCGESVINTYMRMLYKTKKTTKRNKRLVDVMTKASHHHPKSSTCGKQPTQGPLSSPAQSTPAPA